MTTNSSQNEHNPFLKGQSINPKRILKFFHKINVLFASVNFLNRTELTILHKKVHKSYLNLLSIMQLNGLFSLTLAKLVQFSLQMRKVCQWTNSYKFTDIKIKKVSYTVAGEFVHFRLCWNIPNSEMKIFLFTIVKNRKVNVAVSTVTLKINLLPDSFVIRKRSNMLLVREK